MTDVIRPARQGGRAVKPAATLRQRPAVKRAAKPALKRPDRLGVEPGKLAAKACARLRAEFSAGVRKSGYDAVFKIARDAVFDAVFDAAFDAAWEAVFDAAFDAAWEAVGGGVMDEATFDAVHAEVSGGKAFDEVLAEVLDDVLRDVHAYIAGMSWEEWNEHINDASARGAKRERGAA